MTKKIDADELPRFLDAGHSQADAARHFGVTEAAICQRLKVLTSKIVALEKAGEVVEKKLGATARLQRIQQAILTQLD